MKTLQHVLNFPCTAGLLISDFNSCAIFWFLAFAFRVYTHAKKSAVPKSGFLASNLLMWRVRCVVLYLIVFFAFRLLLRTVCVFPKEHAALVIFKAASVPLTFLSHKVFMFLTTVVFGKFIATLSRRFDSNSCRTTELRCVTFCMVRNCNVEPFPQILRDKFVCVRC